MKYDKSYLRNKFILKRKKNYLKVRKHNFNLIFKLIFKHFNKRKITIAGYYPSNYEVNILNFLKKAAEKNFKIALPVIKSAKSMNFKLWIYRDPLCLNKFGILEPEQSIAEHIPDLILVPLVAFDKKLNRIGYGKGYYDRSLRKIKKIKKNTIFLGIAYSFQKSKNIPINRYDFKLDYIFTERGLISANNKL